MKRAKSRATDATRSGLHISLLVAVIAALLATSVLAFSGSHRADAQDTAQTAAQPGADFPDCAPGVDFLGFSDALNKTTFEGTNVGGLSALIYDRHNDVYYSLVDNEQETPARFYTLDIPLDRSGLGEPSVQDATFLRDDSGQQFTGANFDGEGLAFTRKGDLFASSETEPSIRRFSPEGDFIEELLVPEKFLVEPEGRATRNQTFESLSLSPNGRNLYTANEGSLVGDGEDRIRILRYEKRPDGFQPAEEFFYQAEAGQGVVEIVALRGRELLVLERGFVPGEGNTVRIFRVSLKGATDVSSEESLADTNIEPVEKELLVDLANCPESGATTPGTQAANPLLDNFEALTLGPRLPGGRRALLLVSDDNFSLVQVTRVVALGVKLR